MKPIIRFEKQIFKTGEFGEESSLPDLLGFVYEEKLDLIQEPSVEVGYGMRKSSYPYRQQAGYNRKLREIELDTAILENDFLYAEFLPTLGGRLWRLKDKVNDRDLIYHNDVIRFSNLAICNAWFSGGVEWNISLIGHSPFTARPLFVAELMTDDEVPVLRMYEFERLREAVYQMDFWLGEQDRFLNCRMRIRNVTNHEIPMYWWSNIAVPEYPGGRLAVPASKAFTADQERVWKTDIPVVDGIDISKYEHIPTQVDYFFDIPENAHKFIANIDKDGNGLLHLSTDRLQSRKLFSWGHDTGSQNWQRFLTEKAGNYIEIQAGVPKTQYGCVRMPANAEWEWLEQYGPIAVPEEILDKEYPLFLDAVQRIVDEHWHSCNLSDMLINSKVFADQPGKTVHKGSNGGACYNCIARASGEREIYQHLDFAKDAFDSSPWKAFIETGILPLQNPENPPEDFVCNPWLFKKLEDSTKQGEANENNWLAWYEMGCMLLAEDIKGERLEAAREALYKADKLSRNPWTLEALAVLSINENNMVDAAKYMVLGAEQRKKDIQYLKTAAYILLKAEAFSEWLNLYDSLEAEVKEDPRLYFDSIIAMSKADRKMEAFELLNRKNHMFLDDLRECEGSIEDLWQGLHKDLFGREGVIPENLRFISGEAKSKA